MTIEAYLHRLTDERVHAERVLLVTRCVVEVGEGPQRRQHRVRAVQHLDLERIEGSGGCGFCRVNVQPECQCRRGCGGRNSYRLRCRVGVGGAVAIEPGVPRSAVWRLC